MPLPPDRVCQAAALALWGGRVCLVTSRGGRRWVLPKGTVDAGWSPAECAVQEAWEEAGLVGDVEAEPVGSYVYEKDGRPRRVALFRMAVADVHDSWPECELRRRVWLTPAEAVWRIDIPDLRDLIRVAVQSWPGRLERLAQ